jgi:hypothetical protein
MPVALDLLIKKTEAALAAATDPRKKVRLERDLASFKLTAMRAEAPDEDDPDEDDEPEEDDKASKAAKKAEMSKKKHEAAGHKAKADQHRAKAAEYDSKAKECLGEESEDEDAEAKAMRAELHTRLTASLPEGAAAALASQAGQDAALRMRLEAIEKERAAERKEGAINAALAGRRITPGEAKTLATKPIDFVTDFLAMRPKAIVNTDASDLLQPTMTPDADLDPKAMAEINAKVSNLPNLTDAQRAEVRQKMIDGRRALANGAPIGRY